MRSTALMFGLAIAFTANACGGGSSGGATGTGGHGGGTGTGGSGGSSAGTGGSSDGGGDALPACGTRTDPSTGESCNTLEATGPCVVATIATGTPPSGSGGLIAEGTYDLVSRTIYPGGDGGSINEDQRRETLVITGTGPQMVQMVQQSGTTVQRQTGTALRAGSVLGFTPTCPPPSDGGDNGGTTPYTATNMSLTIYDVNGNGDTRVSMYMKR